MLKLWFMLALACAGAPAARQVVTLGTGVSRGSRGRAAIDVLLRVAYRVKRDRRRPVHLAEIGFLE